MAKGKKKIKRAYYKGREEGFDRGLNVAKMVYADAVAEIVLENDALHREIEKLNSEIILGDRDGLSEDDIESD